MPALCLVEVTQLRTKAVDGRQRYFQRKKIKLETKAMPLLRQCNTGRICVTLPIITTEKILPAYTRCSENHSNTCAEIGKIRGLKFDTLYWRRLAAYREI